MESEKFSRSMPPGELDCEEDEELMTIFLGFYRESFVRLRDMASGDSSGELGSAKIRRAREIVSAMGGAAHYMGYDGIVEALEEWNEKLASSLRGNVVTAEAFAGFVVSYGHRVQALLPRLQLPFRSPGPS